MSQRLGAMPPTLRSIALALGLLGTCTLGPGLAFAKEKSGSTSQASEKVAPLDRVGYHPPPGAQVIGDPVVSPEGEDVAFFEQRGEQHELVVCPQGGGVPGRWPVKAEVTRLHIYWVAPTEIVLGTDVLAPKMIVKWQVARG